MKQIQGEINLQINRPLKIYQKNTFQYYESEMCPLYPLVWLQVFEPLSYIALEQEVLVLESDVPNPSRVLWVQLLDGVCLFNLSVVCSPAWTVGLVSLQYYMMTIISVRKR